jgi:hypothetical protein
MVRHSTGKLPEPFLGLYSALFILGHVANICVSIRKTNRSSLSGKFAGVRFKVFLALR